MSLNNAYVRTLTGADLLEGGRTAKAWDTVDLTRETKSGRKGEMRWTLSAEATIYGFAYWRGSGARAGHFDLDSTGRAAHALGAALFSLLLTPIAAKAGETVLLTLRSQSSEEAGTHLGWTAVHFDAAEKTLGKQAMDLDKG